MGKDWGESGRGKGGRNVRDIGEESKEESQSVRG